RIILNQDQRLLVFDRENRLLYEDTERMYGLEHGTLGPMTTGGVGGGAGGGPGAPLELGVGCSSVEGSGALLLLVALLRRRAQPWRKTSTPAS
ncbi:MAG: hypothetical protein K1X89_23255, partial [Myxococcaceae bacterium]|nr:hypothetical protein [Myxococcaceae bacterium]